MSLKTPEYSSGICNIGGAEVHRRKISGFTGAVVSVVFYISCIALNAPKEIRAIIFIPLIVAWTGLLQSRKKFCVAFGLMGVFNFGELGKSTRIKEVAMRSRDRKQALVMLAEAVALSVVSALVFTLIPA